MTPISAEGLVSLHSLIKQDAYMLNGTSIQRLERHIQKLVDAAQISFAKRALLHDQKQMLTRMNNEAKVRRSTQSLVLGQGQGRVMSFEDIEAARAARAAKEVIKGKGKRGRKRKSTALEADEPEEPEPEPEVARMIDAPVPWRAPVAQMI
jgi:septum formation inhibitor MinC